MRLAVSVVLSAAVAACSGSGGAAPDSGVDSGVDGGKQTPTSQESYTYYGCDDAGTYGCPRDRVFMCALDFIRTKHVHCSDDPDCTVVTLGNCVGKFDDCAPAAVAVLEKSSFLTEVGVEENRYCSSAQCFGAGECAEVTYAPRCIQGECQAIPVPDGGTDAGETDAGTADAGGETDAGTDAGLSDGGP